MNTNRDWDPSLYLRYKNERTRPVIDLVSRIDLREPEGIIDIGCGPGNSTEVLARRWPGSAVTGIDNSPSMIEKAQRDYPGMTWRIRDASFLDLNEKYGLVFSNAAIQWIPNHERLVMNLMEMVDEGGALAVQIPLYLEMPLSKVIDRAFRKNHGSEAFDFTTVFNFHDSGFYYDLLADRAARLEMWETWYIHAMASHREIVEMIKSTGMRPYLERMPDGNERAEFEDEVLRELAGEYSSRKNGMVLFPFKRLFFIAYK